MVACPECAHQNIEGALLCAECGSMLQTSSKVAASTKHLNNTSGEVVAKATWGTARFGEDAIVTLRIRDVAEAIMLHPTRQTVLGRSDSDSPKQPDLDLTSMGGFEKGVSRLHAAISRSEDTLMLMDLGSVNGTYLNGQRLIPNQARVLRDGDEIRLGKLVAHIYFR
ncbi:MAG: hypothetical protein CL610_09525 [Anaerolineaceae bacterium]|nr:hypothetical protein [Anaerolineaceae bacterium]